MKKNIFAIIVSTSFGISVLAAPALAATTISFVPAATIVSAGQSFSVVINVNPLGVSNYAEKVEVRYPADTLEVKEFTLANKWMALAQPGYDSIDNTSGVMVKTAGYPGGFFSAVTFGTVSFHAKKVGSGVITIGDHSLAFEASSQSASYGAPASFSITTASAGGPAGTPVLQGNTNSSAQTQEGVTSQNPPVEPPTAASAPQPAPGEQQAAGQPASRSLFAAVGGVLALGSGNAFVGILVLLVILALIAYGIYSSMQRKRKQ